MDNMQAIQKKLKSTDRGLIVSATTSEHLAVRGSTTANGGRQKYYTQLFLVGSMSGFAAGICDFDCYVTQIERDKIKGVPFNYKTPVLRPYR